MVIHAMPQAPPVAPEIGRRQRRREETAEKIFLAAMELFVHKGFAQTTVEEITRAADVGKGTFFNYFPSKEHILGYLIERQKGAVEAHVLLARKGTVKVPEVLARLGRRLTSFPAKSPQMARTMIAAFLASNDVRTKIATEMALGRRWLAEIVEMGQERGELRRNLSPMTMAWTFHRALIGTVLLWAVDPSSPLEKQVSDTIEMVMAGALPPQPAAQAAKRVSRRKTEAR
jgi:AcrR family transcriptional regulator